MDQTPESMDFGSFSRLVHDARMGDASARSEICRQVEQHLRGLADQDLDQALRGKLNPSDIAQQAMLRMIDGFADFRGSSSREFYAWINAILRNEIKSTRRDYRRQKRDVRREIPGGTDGQAEWVSGQVGPDTEMVRREQLERFHHLIARLPSDYAEIIQLRGIEELPFSEVAQRMSRSVDAVTKLWSRALLRLAEEMKRTDDSHS